MAALKCLLVISIVIGISRSEMFNIADIKCKLEDTQCMTASVQKAIPSFLAGIPEIGVDVLDVMKLDPIRNDISGFKFTIVDGRLKGLKNVIVDRVKFDTSKGKIEVSYHGNLTMTGHYMANGQILILPISGDGQLKIKLQNIKVKFTLDYVLEKKEEKQYIHITKTAFVFEVIDNARLQLTNLFNGNKVLSDAMHVFLNDNWKQLSQEFGGPVLKAGADKIINNVNIFFSRFPIEDITIM